MAIVGVSYGSPERAAKWVENQGYPFEVWSDRDKVLGQALGAGDGGMAKRVSALLDSQGRVVVRYPEVGFGRHPSEMLDDVRRLEGELR